MKLVLLLAAVAALIMAAALLAGFSDGGWGDHVLGILPDPVRDYRPHP